MWNDSSFTDQETGAGFMNSSSQFESPSIARKERRSQPIAPVTIKMIHDSPDDTITIAGNEIHMIVVVGMIQSVDITSTKTTYGIDDSTGIIEGVHWLDSSSPMDSDNQSPMMEMTYCKLVGTVRTQMGKRHILIHNIVPITDINRLTMHLLEVIHAFLKLMHLEKLRNSGGGAQNTGQALGTGNDGFQQRSGAQVPAQGNMQGLSGPSRLVYQIIKMNVEEIGINKNEIYGSLKGKISPAKIDEIIEDLSSEGLIFCSIDEDHFKASDC